MSLLSNDGKLKDLRVKGEARSFVFFEKDDEEVVTDCDELELALDEDVVGVWFAVVEGDMEFSSVAGYFRFDKTTFAFGFEDILKSCLK